MSEFGDIIDVEFRFIDRPVYEHNVHLAHYVRVLQYRKKCLKERVFDGSCRWSDWTDWIDVPVVDGGGG